MNQSQTDNSAPERRIIVMVPDEPGSLARVTEALAKGQINIESIEGRQIGDFGVITLRTSDDDAALHALLRIGLRAVTSDAVVFSLPDEPGALARVAQRFGQHQVNVRTIHILHRLAAHALVAVTTDDNDLARSLLDEESLV